MVKMYRGGGLLAAVLMFAAAAFRIADGHYIIGALCIASAICFSAAGRTYRKKEREKDTDQKKGSGEQI